MIQRVSKHEKSGGTGGVSRAREMRKMSKR